MRGDVCLHVAVKQACRSTFKFQRLQDEMQDDELFTAHLGPRGHLELAMHVEGFVDGWFQPMRLKTRRFSILTGRLRRTVISL